MSLRNQYAFANEWRQARERLSALAGWLDPGTRHMTFLQLREALLSTAGVTGQDLTDLDALLDDPEFAFIAQLRVAARGRRSI